MVWEKLIEFILKDFKVDSILPFLIFDYTLFFMLPTNLLHCRITALL